jgi:hypothetical protein
MTWSLSTCFARNGRIRSQETIFCRKSGAPQFCRPAVWAPAAPRFAGAAALSRVAAALAQDLSARPFSRARPSSPDRCQGAPQVPRCLVKWDNHRHNRGGLGGPRRQEWGSRREGESAAFRARATLRPSASIRVKASTISGPSTSTPPARRFLRTSRNSAGARGPCRESACRRVRGSRSPLVPADEEHPAAAGSSQSAQVVASALVVCLRFKDRRPDPDAAGSVRYSAVVARTIASCSRGLSRTSASFDRVGCTRLVSNTTYRSRS